MGQKVNPIGLRLGINRTWDSRWYADGEGYGVLLHEDIKLRQYLLKRLSGAGVSRVVIERPAKQARITIHTARPGVVIGQKGADIETLRVQIGRMTGSEVSLNIVEVRKPEVDAMLVAENIAQARIEEVRSLVYDDVGNVGYAPDGILARTEIQNVSGRDYTVETTVQYVGSLTGLNVVAQGGDGVEGTYDLGVNYKSVVVTVSPVVGSAKPVTMETIVSPPTIGALETVAVVQVDLDLYEPYDPYGDPPPKVQIVGPNTYVSSDANLSQYFAGVDLGTYTIQTFGSTDWLIDPVSISSGATFVDAIGGWNAKRTVRLYQPASLTMTVNDQDTGLPITNASLTLLDLSSGWTYTGSPGEYSFSDLVPDLYRVTASASGYATTFVDLDVPGFGGGTSASGTIDMEVQAFTGVDYVFTVNYVGWSSYVINGARVEVVHPTLGSWIGYTDENGQVTLNIPASTGSLTATASTVWGHGDAVWSFSTGSGSGSRTLQVSKPSGTDRFRLRRSEEHTSELQSH